MLLTRRAQVTRLINRWTPALADSMAAMNLFRDESAERPASQIASVRDAAGGACADTGEFVAEDALRGTWRLRCATGDLAVRRTLAPTVPAQVQSLSVTSVARDAPLGPAPVCRR